MYNRYAVADLHGQLKIYEQIKEYINDDDIVYVLGDCGDRGDHPWTTIKAVLNDEQFIYLMGNHELMLIQAIDEYLSITKGQEDNDKILSYPKSSGRISDLYFNGGKLTLKGWFNDPDRMKYYKQLQYLPLELRLAAKNEQHFIYLNHAGYLPTNLCPDIESFLWDRLHFHDTWDNPDGHILIHGHTPIQHLHSAVFVGTQTVCTQIDTSKGYYMYDNNHRIDIDNGCYTTHQATLINIDTLESVIIKE